MKKKRLTATSIISLSGELAGQFRQQISQGSLPLGARLPTERELAVKHKVSRTTVREAMEILQSEHLVAPAGRGTFVTDPRHAPVDSTIANWIGALVYGREYYFEPVVQAASAQASRRGYAIATGMNDSSEMESLHVNAFVRNRVRGIVMAPHGPASPDNYRRLLAAGLGVVLMDGFLSGHDEDYVAVDNRQGTFLAIRHLFELGHRRIGYITHDNPTDIPCQPERRRGFLEACREFGLSVNPEWMLQQPDAQVLPNVTACLKSRNRPTAFVAFNDPMAIQTIHAARKLGLSVPEDLSVVGFDNSDAARKFAVPLTSIEPEKPEMGISR